MEYIFHAFGILCIVNMIVGFLAGDNLSEKARRARPVSILASVIYALWLFMG